MDEIELILAGAKILLLDFNEEKPQGPWQLYRISFNVTLTKLYMVIVL